MYKMFAGAHGNASTAKYAGAQRKRKEFFTVFAKDGANKSNTPETTKLSNATSK
jgi:hypothetical protein